MKRTNTRWPQIALLALGIVVVILSASFPARISQAQGGPLLAYGSSTQGSLSAAAPTAAYSFDGAAGDLIQVAVIPLTGDLQPSVTLAGPDGQSLTTGQFDPAAGHNASATVAYILPQAGTYRLTISGLNASSGDFVLRLEGGGQPPARPCNPIRPCP